MLTAHRGERDAYGAASAMALHLQQQTLPPEQHSLLHAALGDHQPEAGTLAAAVPRRDAEPRLAALLGVDPGRTLQHIEVVRLLAGRRTDGAPVPGRLALHPTRTPGGALGLDPARPPGHQAIKYLLAGRRTDGSDMAAADGRSARRALGLLGIPPGHVPTQDELDRIASDRRLDGSALRWPSASRSLFTPRISVAYLGLCFSAHKSISLAWAMAPVPSEAALVVQSHRDAVTATLLQVETELGRARRGRGGAAGYDSGPLLWVQFHHYTARPTPGGEKGAEGGGDLACPAGSPQLHTHVTIPNTTLTAEGHVGGLDLQRLNGRLKELGGLYQAHLATALRQLGAEVGLDAETGAARLLGVPDEACRAFSRRTAKGTRAARRYAESIGLAWDDLAANRKVALVKQATQGDPRAAKADDLGDWAAWRRQAEALGWQPQPLLRPELPVALPDTAERLRIACEVAGGLLGGVLVRTGSLGESEVRTAATRGLVASGIGDADDLDAAVQQIFRDGIRHGGALVPLAWTASVDAYGQAWGSLAVAPDACTTAERGGPGRDAAAPTTQPPAPQAGAGVDAVLVRLRGAGRARMVPGGYHEAVEGAAGMWEARHAAHRHDPAYRLAVFADSHGSARDVAQAIRRRRQRLSLLGPDQVCVDATDSAGAGHELRLAPGDRVRLGCHVNAECADGRRGIIGRDGSVVDLLLIEAAGVTVRNRQGRTGRVDWQRLRDARSGRYLLAHADALALGDVRDWGAGTERILVLPSGCEGRRLPEALVRPGGDAGLFLLLSEEAERGQLASKDGGGDAPATEGALWAGAAANLGRRPDAEGAAALLRLAGEGRLYAVRSLLAATHVQERRQAEGVEPATLHRTLLHRRDAASFQDSPALQGWMRDHLVPDHAAAAAAAGLVVVIGRALAAAGRRLREIASARRASWLARSTMARRAQDRQGEAAVLGTVTALCSSAEERAGLATLMAATAAGVQAASSRAAVDAGGLIMTVRALAARGTLDQRFAEWREQAAVRDAVLALRATVDSRERVLALMLPSVTAGVQDAVRGGIIDAGRQSSLAQERRQAWLAQATLHWRLQDQRGESGVAQVATALQAGTARRTLSLETLAGIAPALQGVAIEPGTGAAALVRAALRQRRTAWLARATLHQRACQQREDRIVAPMAGRIGAAAKVQNVAVQQVAGFAADLPEAVGHGLVLSMARLRKAARTRRTAWLARSGLAHQLRQRQEEAAILRVLRARGRAMREQDVVLASMPAVFQGVQEAALRSLSGIGPALARVRLRRRQQAGAAQAAPSATSRPEPVRFSVRAVLSAVAARLNTAVGGSAPAVEAVAGRDKAPAQPVAVRAASAGTAAAANTSVVSSAIAGDSRTAQEHPVSRAAAPAALPYTQDEVMRLLQSGDVVPLSRDGTTAVFRTNVAELGADTADTSNAGGLLGLGLLLRQAGVHHTRQDHTSAGGLVIEYGLADLARMLAAQTRETADQWLTRLRRAAKQSCAREERMKAAGEHRRAIAAITTPRPVGPRLAAPVARLAAAAVAADGSSQDLFRRQLLEDADVIHFGAGGKLAGSMAADARPTLRFFTLRAIHEGPTKPDEGGRVGLYGLGEALTNVGVPSKTLKGRDGMIVVLVDRDDLAVALAKLDQAEVGGWVLRLRTAAWHSGNLVRTRAARGQDRGGQGPT